MNDCDVYQCLSCSRAYVIMSCRRICCPFCQSKEREQTGRIEDPALFLQQVLNYDPCALDDLLAPLRGPDRCRICRRPAMVSLNDLHFCQQCWHDHGQFLEGDAC